MPNFQAVKVKKALAFSLLSRDKLTKEQIFISKIDQQQRPHDPKDILAVNSTEHDVIDTRSTLYPSDSWHND